MIANQPYHSILKKLKKDRNRKLKRITRGGGEENDILPKYNEKCEIIDDDGNVILTEGKSTVVENCNYKGESEIIAQTNNTFITVPLTFINDSKNYIGNKIVDTLTSKKAQAILNIELYANAVSQVASLTGETLQGVSHVAVPLLAGTGVGLPLAAIILLANKIAIQAKQNITLVKLLKDVSEIITNCFLLNQLITSTVILVGTQLNKMIENTTDTEVKQILVYSKSILNKLQSQSDLIKLINTKLDSLQKMLVSVSLDSELAKNDIESLSMQNNKDRNLPFNPEAKSSSLGYLTDKIKKGSTMFSQKLNATQKRLSRFFYSAASINGILRELTIINSLFMIYNSQYDWILQHLERKLKNISYEGQKLGTLAKIPSTSNPVPESNPESIPVAVAEPVEKSETNVVATAVQLFSTSAPEFFDTIWEVIESREEFRNYLYPPDFDTLVSDVQQQTTDEQVDNMIVEAQEQALNVESEAMHFNSHSGGKKTRKYNKTKKQNRNNRKSYKRKSI
jgi:hypothetical protein